MPSKVNLSQLAENRRHQMMEMRMSGATVRQIAQVLKLSGRTVHVGIKRRLAEVRREDKEAVNQEYNLQRARYERLLLRWWPVAISDRDDAAHATEVCIKLLHQLDSIGGLIPEKPLINFYQDNRQQDLTFHVTYDEGQPRLSMDGHAPSNVG